MESKISIILRRVRQDGMNLKTCGILFLVTVLCAAPIAWDKKNLWVFIWALPVWLLLTATLVFFSFIQHYLNLRRHEKLSQDPRVRAYSNSLKKGLDL